MKGLNCLIAVIICAVGWTNPVGADDITPLIEELLAAGPHGAGSTEAAAAWEELARADPKFLPDLLAAIDDAGPVAANWLRTAVEAIAQRTLNEGAMLPVAELERFVLDKTHQPRSRRLAYELLVRADPSTPDRMLPGLLDDPSVEIRRDAVARLIGDAVQAADSSEAAKAMRLYRRALAAARDRDQIELLAERLRKAGEKVDLASHFGFLLRWKLIGPFDNTGEKGFDVAYPPERELDFSASYDGKHGTVRWMDHVTGDDYGKVDLNRAFAEEKAVVAYGAAEFISDGARDVQFRIASPNANRLWLNGTLIDGHNIYHAGSQFDQYVAQVRLNPGRNTILIKVCQNEQTQDWARDWEFQFRVCDATGGAILSTDRP
jgi:hypothetical protein